MAHTSSSPDHPSRRRASPLEDAFDRVVSQDPLLGPMAGRHWLHRDLRLTLLTVAGPPLAWLVGGHLLVAGLVTAGFAGLLLLTLWTAGEHGPVDADRLLTGIRWVAVALVAMALLVCWNSPVGPARPGSAATAPGPTVAPPTAHHRP